MNERALTIRQPWADLVMAGVKDVENRTWPVPSTLPQWRRCSVCDGRIPKDDDGGWRLCHNRGAALDGPFPFRLWVHAGREFADEWVRADGLYGTYRLWHPGKNMSADWVPARRLGALLGSVTVTGCHHADDCLSCTECGEQNPHAASHEPAAYEPCSRWAEPDVWHWTLTDPVALPEPIPMRGRLGLWRLPEGVPA